MKASVVIPTYNRGPLILSTMEALARQTLSASNYEVLIVDDGSTDSTRELVEHHIAAHPGGPWKYLRQPQNRGRASACNAGIRAASSPLVLFTDDDCVPSPQWIEMHVRRHAESAEPLSVLGGVTYPKEWLERSNFIRFSNRSYVGNRSTRSLGCRLDDMAPTYYGGLNVSTPREVLLNVGLFNEQIGRGQDVELAVRLWKAGVRLVFEPRASLVHQPPEAASLGLWLSKFTKAYRESVPAINALHPECTTHRFNHWFLESPAFGRESVPRTAVKLLVRSVCFPAVARRLQRFLEQSDRCRWLYFPALFRYVVVTACLETVRKREQANRAHPSRQEA